MISTAKLRLAVFDCDGTLVDSQHAIVACMQAAFTGEGLAAPSLAAVRRIIGLPLAECMVRLAPEADATRLDRLVESYKDAFFTLRQRADHHEPLFEGALAALDAVEAEGWMLGVATGKAMRGLLAVLERHGREKRFVTLQTGDQGPGKPDPAMLERAMAETGATPADTVMIGDTTFDMVMAGRARVRALGVEWGYHAPEELVAAGAHATVDSFAALPAAVTRLHGRETCA